MSKGATPHTAPTGNRVMNWDTWAEEDVEEDEYPDQSVGLPSRYGVLLRPITPILTTSGNFDAWKRSVIHVLEYNDLASLISQDQPRPRYLNDRSQEWARLSMEVSIWMQQSMSGALVRKVKMMGEEVHLADAFMRNTKKVRQKTRSLGDGKRISKLVQLKPCDFDTPVQYVTTYASLYKSTYEHGHDGITMCPYAALLTVLEHIQQSSNMTYYMVHDMLKVDSGDNVNLSEWVTVEVFQYYIHRITSLLMQDDENRLRLSLV